MTKYQTLGERLFPEVPTDNQRVSEIENLKEIIKSELDKSDHKVDLNLIRNLLFEIQDLQLHITENK